MLAKERSNGGFPTCSKEVANCDSNKQQKRTNKRHDTHERPTTLHYYAPKSFNSILSLSWRPPPPLLLAISKTMAQAQAQQA